MKQKHNTTHFKIPKQELIQDLPLGLADFEPIVNRIAEKYPLLSKPEIALIVKNLMEEIRNQILDGNTVHIRKYLHNMRLYSYVSLEQDKLRVGAKIQTQTPRKIKNASR